MENSILPHEGHEIFTCEIRSIIRNQEFRQSLLCEYFPQLQAVNVDVVEFMMCVSIRFGVASTATRNNLPIHAQQLRGRASDSQVRILC